MKTLDDILDTQLWAGIPENTGADYEADIDTVSIAEFTGIDPRLKLLSHSSRNLIHTCPRKYQLYRLNSIDTEQQDINSDITLAYGTVVGIGVQSILEGKTEVQTIMDMFLAWDIELDAANPKQKKSFSEAIFAVQRFIVMMENGYLSDYELVYIGMTPDSTISAIELSFKINLPDDFSYRGYVDAVLKHKTTGEVLVLECKTTRNKPNSAVYKNSGQALGYSVVLDKLFPGLSSYTVLYLVYSTSERDYTEFFFEKSLLQRALWLQELIVEKLKIELYEEYGTYPMHGENCFNFFRECEYLSLCTLSTDKLTKPLTAKEYTKMQEENYMFTVDFFELVESQIAKGEM